MRVAILLNRRRARLRTLAKSALLAPYRLASRGWGSAESFVLPEYDSFARLLDPAPVVLGTADEIDWHALASCEVLLWEWGWTSDAARIVAEVRRRIDLTVLMFPGPLDRFWRELDPATLPEHRAAMVATDAVGVMLADTAPLYRALLPHAHVFHMPVPVDVDELAAWACPQQRPGRERLLLTAPTRFTGTASQLPIASFLAFRLLLAARPGLEGVCFTYDDEERRQTESVLGAIGLAEHVRVLPFVRPIFRWLKTLGSCRAGLFLPNGLLQGRTALAAACIGLPMVVSDEIETHRRLFPDTTVRWFDAEGAARACLRLLEDDAFRGSVATMARERVGYYSVANCRRRMQAGVRAAAQTPAPMEAV